MHSRPWIPFALATVGFAGANIGAKSLLNNGLAPLAIAPGRYLIAVPAMLLALIGLQQMPAVTDLAWGRGALLGVINMATPTLTMTLALEHIDATVMALLIGLIPLATVIAAHFFVEGERMQWALIPGTVVALVGTAVLMGRRAGSGSEVGIGEEALTGFLLAGIGIGAAGVGGALSRRFATEVSPKSMAPPQFLAGGLTVGLVGLLSGQLPELAVMNRDGWVVIAVLGIGCTALPFASLLWLSRMVTAARWSLIGYLVPVVGALGAILILNEPFTSRLLLGGALILSGVVIAERAERRRPVPVPI